MSEIRTCIICNKPLPYRHKIACSHKCLGIYQHDAGVLTFKCAVCGKEKTLPKYRCGSEGQKTCSRHCGKVLFFQNKISLKRTYTCTFCKRSFEKLPSQRRGVISFCSNTCHYKWLTEIHALAGSNNPAWKGGKYAFRRWGSRFLFENNRELKNLIASRDGSKCLRCSKTHSKLHIHHADFDGKNHMLNNLVSLCPSCHRTVEELKIPTAHLIVKDH